MRRDDGVGGGAAQGTRDPAQRRGREARLARAYSRQVRSGPNECQEADCDAMDPLDPVYAPQANCGEKCGPLRGAEGRWTRARKRRSGQTGGMNSAPPSGNTRTPKSSAAEFGDGRGRDAPCGWDRTARISPLSRDRPLRPIAVVLMDQRSACACRRTLLLLLEYECRCHKQQ